MITHYDANDCTVTIAGVYITGMGESIAAGKKDENFINPAVGAQGDVVVNKRNDPLGTITLTVQTTSPQKGFLLDLAKKKSTFPVWVTNKSIGERFGGSQAMIANYPELKNEKEAGDREFEIKVFDYDVFSIK